MSWQAPLRSLSAVYRLSALVVALLWGSAPALAVLHVHSSGEVHRYCAEHRAVEDVAADRDQAPPSDGDRTAVRPSRAEQPHQVCAFGHVCRFRELLAQFVLEAAGALQARPVAPPVAHPAPAIAVIVLAPKTSPPV